MSSSIKFIRPDAYEALQKAFESANLRPVITHKATRRNPVAFMPVTENTP